MTLHLSKILGGPEAGWSKDMAEQLKCSNICEILEGARIPLPGTVTDLEKVKDILRRGRKAAMVDDDDDEGITNVAAIVASGKTHEYLAKKEREKQEALKGLQKNFPNWRREHNKFWAIEKRKDGDMDIMMIDGFEPSTAAGDQDDAMEDVRSFEKQDTSQPTTSRPTTASGQQPAPTETAAAAPIPEQESEEARFTREKATAREKRKEEKKARSHENELRPGEIRKEIEVGLERFKAAECGIMMTIADAVHRIISRLDEVGRRQELWDNLVIVGNGSKIKGWF